MVTDRWWSWTYQEIDYHIFNLTYVIGECCTSFSRYIGLPRTSFRLLRNLINIKDHIEKFFAKKPQRFWKNEIFKLRERQRKIVQQNDTYITRITINRNVNRNEFPNPIRILFICFIQFVKSSERYNQSCSLSRCTTAGDRLITIDSFWFLNVFSLKIGVRMCVYECKDSDVMITMLERFHDAWSDITWLFQNMFANSVENACFRCFLCFVPFAPLHFVPMEGRSQCCIVVWRYASRWWNVQSLRNIPEGTSYCRGNC